MRKLLIGLTIIAALAAGACRAVPAASVAQGSVVAGSVSADLPGEGINEPGLIQYKRGARGGCYFDRTSKAGKSYKAYVPSAKCERFGV